MPTFSTGSDTLASVRQQLEGLGFTVSVNGPDDDTAIVKEVSSMGQQVDKGSTITVTTEASSSTGDDDDDPGHGQGQGQGQP